MGWDHGSLVGVDQVDGTLTGKDCVNGGLVGMDQVDGTLARLRVDGHFVGWAGLTWLGTCHQTCS